MEQIQDKKDSLNKVLQSGGFAELKTIYEKELSEAENKLLKAQHAESEATIAYQEEKEHLYIAIALFLSLVTFFLFLVYRQRQKSLKNERRVNEKLQKQNSQLEQQQIKLDGLNQMKNKIFSVLGHDLRSPLAGILTYLQILEMSEDNDEETQEMIHHFSNEINLSLKTLQNILDWSRLQMEEKISDKRAIDMSPLLEEIKSLHQTQAQNKQISLALHVHTKDHLVADIHQVRSILANLLSNAIKFSAENDKVEIHFYSEGNELFIKVIDNGQGVSQEILDNLNEPLRRITSLGTHGEKGTGIGLSLVKEFVALNDGELHFEKNTPRGTIALIKFKRPGGIRREFQEELGAAIA